MIKAADKDFDHYAGLIDKAAAESSADAIAGDLARQGWSLVRIKRISDDPIVIAYVRTTTGIPAGYAVYTADELEHIGSIDDDHTRALVAAAKKMGAVWMNEEGGTAL